MTSRSKAFLFVHCCLAIAGLHATGAMAQAPRVDICHIPPGNPDNPQSITISENALDTHLDHGDSLGPCEPVQTVPVQTVDVFEARPEPGAMCTCPRQGVWRVINGDGWMECGIIGRRTMRGEDRNDGAIWVLDDDCSTIFSEAYERQREDVIMTRGRDCLFFGTAPGEEDGAEVIFDGSYRLENEELITGEYYMDMSAAGLQCSGFAPFRIEFLEPLSERNYDRLEETMQERLEEAREVHEEHQEQIDEYLEETNGGKAFGGRNGQ